MLKNPPHHAGLQTSLKSSSVLPKFVHLGGFLDNLIKQRIS
jgi:hypothetical protein